MKTITWQDVLDYNAPDAEFYGHVYEFLPVVKKAGYRYYSWNGRVYEVLKDNNFTDTGITVDELPATIKPEPLQKILNTVDKVLCDGNPKWAIKKAINEFYEELKSCGTIE